MATSQNGWQVYTSGAHPDLVAIPKVVGRVRRGDVATIFTYLVGRFDREVEDVDVGRDEWGYAYRAIRGKTSGYSNHASATALDLNAMQHPLGRVNTYTPSQRAALRRILNDLEGVVRWGGDYSGRKDEMHFEINASGAAVARVAAKIRAGSLVSRPITGGGSVTIPDVPGGLPAPPKEDDMPTLKEIGDEIWGRLVTNRAGKKVAVGAFIESLPKETADEVLKRPVTVNGTRQTLGAALQSTAINAAVAVRLSQAAAQGQRLSDEEIKRIADETAAQIDLVSAADVADQLTIGVKEK